MISVIMSVHNGEKYLEESIRSVLNQSYRNFDFIIINDGSTDHTPYILNGFGEADKRIRLFHQEKTGLTRALNRGVQLARGKYIARMDGDDICLTERFQEQLSFLEAHAEIAMCGSWIKKIGSSMGTWRFPTDPDFLLCELLFVNPIAHPSVMIRRAVLEEVGFFDESYAYSADYACWVEVARRQKVSNIPKVLLQYRIHSSQMGKTYAEDVRSGEYKKVQALQLDRLGLPYTEKELNLHYFLSTVKVVTTRVYPSLERMRDSGDWLMKMKTANDARAMYPEPAFSETLATYWYFLCLSFTKLGLRSWKVFLRSPLYEIRPISCYRKSMFMLKATSHYDVNVRQVFVRAAARAFLLKDKLRIR